MRRSRPSLVLRAVRAHPYASLRIPIYRSPESFGITGGALIEPDTEHANNPVLQRMRHEDTAGGRELLEAFERALSFSNEGAQEEQQQQQEEEGGGAVLAADAARRSTPLCPYACTCPHACACPRCIRTRRCSPRR